MSAAEVRPPGFVEAPILAELHAACFEPAWRPEDFAALLGTPGVGALLAHSERAPTGFILWRVAGAECEILGMGVRPSGRRRGLGARLLTAALTAAGDSGAEAAFLEVAEDDLRARPLSQRFGFREVGRRRAYYPPGGRGELSGDALIMRRDV